MSAPLEGGHTWSEAWRHECEVRHVCSLPSQAARRLYIEGDPAAQPRIKGVRQQRGDAAADTLNADARALWATGWRTQTPPHPEGQEGANPVDRAPLGERTNAVPGLGSLPAASHGGPLRRDSCVDSGVSAR